MRDPDNYAVKILQKIKYIRFVEEEIANRYPEQKMRCPVHLSIGQEAVAVAVCSALRTDDFVVSTHRSHAHYLAKGGCLGAMIAEIFGKSTGCCHGIGGSMHLIDQSVGFMGSTAIVGGTIPVGVGLGLSIRLKQKDKISCVFMGDGAIEEGVFYESVNFAALKKLPVLFICENNGYSVYSPLSVRQPEGRSISALVESLGVKSLSVDGKDVLENFCVVLDEVQSIRREGRPCFIEFKTYRWREHCGPNFDNDLGYRSEQEAFHYIQNDSLSCLQGRLVEDGILTLEEIEEMELSIKEVVYRSFYEAEKAVPLNIASTYAFIGK